MDVVAIVTSHEALERTFSSWSAIYSISTFHVNIDNRTSLVPIDPTNQLYRAPSKSSSRQGNPPIYPPSLQAVFPIPYGPNIERYSGTPSSGPKIKRTTIDNSSDEGRFRTRVSSTSDFNNNKTVQVREQ